MKCINCTKWLFDYVPFFTEQCDMCVAKNERGQLPTCVQHCEDECLKFGELKDMVKRLNGKPKQTIQIMDFSEYVPQFKRLFLGLHNLKNGLKSHG